MRTKKQLKPSPNKGTAVEVAETFTEQEIQELHRRLDLLLREDDRQYHCGIAQLIDDEFEQLMEERHFQSIKHSPQDAKSERFIFPGRMMLSLEDLAPVALERANNIFRRVSGDLLMAEEHGEISVRIGFEFQPEQYGASAVLLLSGRDPFEKDYPDIFTQTIPLTKDSSGWHFACTVPERPHTVDVLYLCSSYFACKDCVWSSGRMDTDARAEIEAWLKKKHVLFQGVTTTEGGPDEA
jgi:hypothetical protein